MSKTKNIDALIAKILSNDAAPDEISRLELWKSESKANLRIFNKSKRAWDAGKFEISPEQITKDKFEVQNKINKDLQIQLIRSRRLSKIYKVAAAVAIPIAFAISLYFINESYEVDIPEAVCEIISPKGHVSKCVLPDGTKVWVNAGSTLSYDVSDFQRRIRQVELDGEAYFEVVGNKKNPFKVVTELADVNVTGTSFNVKAYTGSEYFEAVLAEGSVDLQFKKTKNQQTVTMNPGEYATYDADKKEVLIKDVDSDVYTAWRNGEILFKDATLKDLIGELERIYDVEFELQDKDLADYRFRGMFSYSNNLIEALEKIEKTAGLNYYVENKKVWLTK